MFDDLKKSLEELGVKDEFILVPDLSKSGDDENNKNILPTLIKNTQLEGEKYNGFYKALNTAINYVLKLELYSIKLGNERFNIYDNDAMNGEYDLSLKYLEDTLNGFKGVLGSLCKEFGKIADSLENGELPTDCKFFKENKKSKKRRSKKRRSKKVENYESSEESE
jgi:hypothetical protein